MIEIFRPAVNLETQTNRKDTEYPEKVQVGPLFGKNPLSRRSDSGDDGGTFVPSFLFHCPESERWFVELLKKTTIMKPNFSKALPKIVSTAEWQIARDRLLGKEKAHTRLVMRWRQSGVAYRWSRSARHINLMARTAKQPCSICSKRAANSSCTTLCSLRTFAVGLRPAAMLVPGTPTTLAT